MKKPNIKLSSWYLYTWGVEVCEGLAFFSETEDFAKAFQTVVDGMKGFVEERRPLEIEIVPLRAKVRFADYNWDASLRSFAKNVEIADGGKRASLHAAIFTDGVAALTAPSGAGQIAPAEAFIARLTASKAPGIDPLRAEWLPKLRAALDSLKSAIAGRDQAYRRLSDLIVRERAAKEDFDISVEKLMGQLRAIFPKDSARWDVIIPTGKTPSTSAGETDESVPITTT